MKDALFRLDTGTLERELDALRPLARTLIGDGDAEDLIQDTLIVAMKSPGPTDGNWRGFLRGIARNLARMRYRGQARRLRNERRAPSPDVPVDPADAVSRLEMGRSLHREIARLPKPTRDALRMRYFDQLTPKQIATRIGEPDATVRARIKRGLDRVRDRYEERRDRPGWVLVLLGGVALTKRYLQRLGQALHTKKGLAALFTAILGTVGMLASSSSPDTTPSHGPMASKAISIDSEPSPVRHSVAPPPTVTAPPVEVDGWRLVGAVRGLKDSYPLTTRAQLVATKGMGASWIEGPSVPVDSRGRFDVLLPEELSSDPSIEALIVEIDDPSYLRVQEPVFVRGAGGETQERARFDIDLNMTLASVVSGRVVDERGEPIEGARVSARTEEEWFHREVQSDAQGAFALRLAHRGTCELMVSHCASLTRQGEIDSLGFVPRGLKVAMAPGERTTVGPIVLSSGVGLQGIARDPQGRPEPGVIVRAKRIDEDPRKGDRAGEPRFHKTLTDDRGQFEIWGLAPGRYRLHREGPKKGEHPASCSVIVEAPARGVCLKSESEELVVQVRSQGRPLSHATVRVETPGSPADLRTWRGRSDGEGLCRVRVPLSSSMRVTVSAQGHRANAVDSLVSVGMPALSFDLVPMHVSPEVPVRLHFETPSLERCWVAHESDGHAFSWIVPVEEGRAVCELPRLPGLLRVRPGAGDGGCTGFYAEQTFDFDPSSEGEVDFSVPLESAGRLRLRLEDREGRCLEGRAVLRDSVGVEVPLRWMRHRRGLWTWSSRPSHTWGAGDVLAERPLKAGTWTLEVDSAEGETRRHSVVIRAFKITRMVIGLD